MIDRAMRSALLENLSDLGPGDAIGVGVSGGADSVALLRAAVHVGAELTIAVHAVVIDHQLQAESEVTAMRAAQLCDDLGASNVAVIAVDVATGAGTGGLEASARDARRTAFQKYSHDHGLAAVLLGHTREDQAETVILGLARGSGARSLSGMRSIDGLYRRPLLDIARAHVRDTVADLETVDDPHNSDEKFSRVRVRQNVLPLLESELGPGVVQALARTADMLRDDADALDALAQSHMTNDCARLMLLSPAIRTRVIRRLAIEAGSPANDLTREHVLMVDALLSRWHGQGPINLPGAVNCQRADGRLSFHKAHT